MKRRNFLVGVGGTAIGASALVGSGAFTSVEAQRKMKISVEKDSQAYLQLTESDGIHGQNYVHVDDEDGTLYIDIADSGYGGDNEGAGLNRNANTIMRDLFHICNHGKQEVYVWVENLPDGVSIWTDSNADGDDVNLNADNEGQFHGPGNIGHPIAEKLILGVGDCHNEVGFGFSKEFVNDNPDGDEFNLEIWAATYDEIEKRGLGPLDKV